jgi:hypothetical protein
MASLLNPHIKSYSADELENMFLSDEKIELVTKKVKTYQKLCKNDANTLIRITDIGIVSGHKLDPECCAEIDDFTLRNILLDAISAITNTMPVKGGNYKKWNIGGMGSIWFDLDASIYGLDYIRCAFYMKEEGKPWNKEKNYVLRVTAEKANRG